MNAFLQYIKDSYTELHEKVTWPTWPEAQRDTWVVAVATIILAGIGRHVLQQRSSGNL